MTETKRILVRNIGDSTKRDIETLFARFGPLTEIKMPIDRLTRRQAGFAFVTFKTAKHAATATSTLNGTGFQDRTLELTPNAREVSRVGSQRDATTEGTPRRSDQSQGDTKGEISGQRSHNKSMLAETKTAREPGRIFIRNLSHRTAKKDIEALFTRIGQITKTSMAVDRLKRRMRFAFVTFKTAEHATNAISALNGTSLQGWKLHLLPSIAKEPPRVSLQKDPTAGETLRRSGQRPRWTKLRRPKSLVRSSFGT